VDVVDVAPPRRTALVVAISGAELRVEVGTDVEYVAVLASALRACSAKKISISIWIWKCIRGIHLGKYALQRSLPMAAWRRWTIGSNTAR
jgi:hypothetical protein